MSTRVLSQPQMTQLFAGTVMVRVTVDAVVRRQGALVCDASMGGGACSATTVPPLAQPASHCTVAAAPTITLLRNGAAVSPWSLA
jgi:hypothetical protein